MAKIEIKNVSFYYRDNKQTFLALEDINLTVEDGEFVCLVGHSGCGKSTLLSLLAGLNEPEFGEILVNGKPITHPSIQRAMVFQHYSLLPWMTVQKNVAFSIQHSHRDISKARANEEALNYLEDVGMESASKKYPFQLSGGMRQRVAIARALAMQSEILLLDEPFGALDARTRIELQELLLHLWHSSEQKRTVVFVTHDLTEAMLLADRIVFMRPKHIERIVEDTFPRPRDLEELVGNQDFRAMKNELMGLFYTETLDSQEKRIERTDPIGKAERYLTGQSDDELGIFHYDDVSGGA